MRSKLICFEGIDGSGKTLQIEKLDVFLKNEGKSVIERSYPVYDSFFGNEIGKRLAGTDGQSASNVDPMSMALWYALDRWQDYSTHRKDFDETDIVLLNRYTLSSAVYQSLRQTDETMVSWIDKLEHEILQLPRPDLYIILDVPPTIAECNIANKGQREYIGDRADIYESDSCLQQRAAALYRNLGRTMPNASLISCHFGGDMLDAGNIHRQIVTLLRQKKIM